MPRNPQSARPCSAARNEILDELRAAVGEADLRVILGVFRTDVAAQLADLRDFVDAGKLEAARRVAHRLAGLMSQFGAAEAAGRAHRMAKDTGRAATAKDVAALDGACRKAVAAICGAAAEQVVPTALAAKSERAAVPPNATAELKRTTTRRRTEPVQLA
jgi:HPt (histidine-containing phosphotransfer) domain-containing protein